MCIRDRYHGGTERVVALQHLAQHQPNNQICCLLYTSEAASANAHYIWYYFAAIGLIAAVALLLFAKITESIDKKKESSR